MMRTTAAVLGVLALLPGVALAETAIRVMAANTSSGNYQSYDPGHGTRIFQGLDPDVVLIQEFNYGDNATSTIDGWVSSTFGSGFDWYREGGAQIPNGIISRWPIVAAGEWDDPQVSNRDFAWARIDIPGDIDLWAISVHLLTANSSTRNAEAQSLAAFIDANVPDGDYLIVGGDFNTDSRSEPALTTLSSQVVTSAPYPVDQAGTGGTNASRAKPYDWVLVDGDLAAHEIPVAIGGNAFQNGLVFDSRVYTPLSDVSPVQSGDSGATNMQHMAVVRDFSVPDDGSGGGDDGGGDDGGSGGVLVSGVPVSDTVASGEWDQYTLEVPAGATQLSIQLTGSSGDADLYVRDAAAPTSGSWDFRPYLNGSNETVTVSPGSSPALTAGAWYIGVNGYSSASYTLEATVTAGDSGGGNDDGGGEPTALLDVSSSVSQGSWKNYTIDVPVGTARVTIEMTGSGDGDLYVRHGSSYPTLSEYDFRPYLYGSNETVVIDDTTSPALQPGPYWLSVYGYADASFTLTAVAE